MINLFLTLHLLFAPAPLSRDLSVMIAEATIESDLDPTATECPGHSSFKHHDNPSWASPAHPCYCGLWQTTATSKEQCLAQREPSIGLRARNDQFRLWSDFCKSKRSGLSDAKLTHCIIAGYATGVPGAYEVLGYAHSPSGVSGAKYANYLLWRAAQVRSRFRTAGKGFVAWPRQGV